MRLKHVALHVPDIEAAESWYAGVFAAEVVTREALGDDGAFRQLPSHAGWDDAREAGITLQMVGLRRDDLIIALFPGDPSPGSIYLIGVVADPDEIGEVRAALPEGTIVEVDQASALTFLDPFGFRWQLSGPGFLGSGNIRGNWLDL